MPKVVIAFDIESHLFGPGNMAPRVVCVSWATLVNRGIVVGDDIEQWLHTALDRALADEVVLVGANVAYDMACLMNHFPSAWDKIWKVYGQDSVLCVQTRERLLDIAVGELNFPLVKGKKYKSKYSLADIAKVRLGRDLAKGADTWRMRYSELDGVPLDQWPQPAVDYAVGDAEVTFDVYRAQESRMRSMNYHLPTQFHDTRAQLALHLMSVWGVEIDPERVDKEWNNYAEKMEALIAGMDGSLVTHVVGTDEFPFASDRKTLPSIKQNMKATREAVERSYPGKVPRTKPSVKFPEGQVKTDADTIAMCDYEPLKRLTKFNGYQKVCNTYLNKFFHPIVHARFWNVGAATGRTSCSGPNLQNPPRAPGVRECIRAREGRVFVFTDFDSQEMRTLAQACLDLLGASRLADRYKEDRYFDPHLEFAAAVADLDIAAAQELLRAKDPKIKEMRQQAKVANFGFPGGMAAKTFVDYAKGFGVEITEERARALHNKWHAQWPEMKDYFAHINKLVGEAGYGTQIFPRTGFRRGMVGYTDAANGYFQHLASVASKAALWKVTRKAYNDRTSAMYGSRPVLFVHDEVGMEVPEEACHEAAVEMEQAMVEAMEVWTPDVPAAASATASRIWSKKAERVEVDGRIAPWEESNQVSK